MGVCGSVWECVGVCGSVWECVMFVCFNQRGFQGKKTRKTGVEGKSRQNSFVNMLTMFFDVIEIEKK